MYLRSSLRLALLAAGLLTAVLPSSSAASERYITIASTTSTENSGLFDHILPKFKQETKIDVRVVAVGTGQAIRIAASGDADVLFVHHKPSEEKFVAEGNGVSRLDVMYNDFVIVGPASDPAAVKGSTDAVVSLSAIARSKSPFTSRGDDSGTHKKERSLWKRAGVELTDASASWYRETGSGMGATLNTASAMDAYALTDRATWLSFGNKGALEILVEGDSQLFNQYGVILVNPEKHPNVKAADGQAFLDWVVSSTGQKAIGEYRILGQQAFFPNAK